jgi:transposase
MSYLRGPDRSEVQLLPACLDDYVPSNSSARFVDAYVEGLDFPSLGFRHAQPAATGRPPYHPADLLKLYVYGYLNRVRSSRRLETEAGRNLELMWLLRGVRPDFKTIADFRKENRAAFKPLFKNFNLLCRKLDLFGAELVAIDGSKFKAVNSSRRNFSREQLGELIEKVEARIEEYMSQLDQADTEAQGVISTPTVQSLQEKVSLLRERKGRYDELLNELESRQDRQISLTDADARNMKGPHGHCIGYNVQVAVDSKHHLIVTEDVVQEANDLGQLSSMAAAAKQELQAQTLKVTADKGYHAADQLEACEAVGVETFVPAHGKTKPQGKEGQILFAKDRFRYDEKIDAYCCPGGQTLPRTTQDYNHGKKRHVYYNYAACRKCGLRAQCTLAAYRKIIRRTNESVMERAFQRVVARPDLVARRKEIVEHVIGTFRNWNYDKFLTKGLDNVRTEFSLSALAYNLRRVVGMMRVDQLIAAAQAS